MSLSKWGKALRDVSRVTGWPKNTVSDFLKIVGFDKVVAIVALEGADFSTLHAEWSAIVAAKHVIREARRAEMREVSRIAICRHDARKNREGSRAKLAAGEIEIYRKPVPLKDPNDEG